MTEAELPNGWALAQIPDLIGVDGVFVDGDWVESKDQDPSGDVRLIQLADIGDGSYLSRSNRFLTKKRAVELGCTFLRVGDVLIARMPDPLGRACIFPGDTKDAVTVVDVCIVRPSGEHFSSQWLMHFVNAPAFREGMHALQSGSTRKRISRGNLATLSLPIPPRNEQNRIVAKVEELLSDLNVGVAELKAAQKKLTLYRQSILKAAVEGALTADWRRHNRPAESGAQLLERILKERRARWEEKQRIKFKQERKPAPRDWQKKYPEPVAPSTGGLPELPRGWVWASVDQLLLDIETGKSFKCEERPPRNHEVGVVKVSAVTWGEYDEEESKTCRDNSMIRPQLFVRSGDFLFSRANTIELVGACVIARHVSKRVMLSDKILRFVLVDDFLKPWLLALLRSEVGRKQIESLASGNQESMRNIGQERLKQIAVPMPSAQEIECAVDSLTASLDAAGLQESAIELSLNQTIAQRKNVLRTAFAGQLVPQDPNEEPASRLLERIRVQRAKAPKARKTKKQREIAAVVSKLIDVLAEAGDWMPAQEVFRRCGVADGALTERIEEVYAELRKLDKAGRLAVQAVSDAQGRKLYDKLKLRES